MRRKLRRQSRTKEILSIKLIRIIISFINITIITIVALSLFSINETRLIDIIMTFFAFIFESLLYISFKIYFLKKSIQFCFRRRHRQISLKFKIKFVIYQKQLIIRESYKSEFSSSKYILSIFSRFSSAFNII